MSQATVGLARGIVRLRYVLFVLALTNVGCAAHRASPATPNTFDPGTEIAGTASAIAEREYMTPIPETLRTAEATILPANSVQDA